MASSTTHGPAGVSISADAPEAYWEEVERLGIHDMARMADGPDFVGKTADGRYVRVPDPRRYREPDRVGALLALTAFCARWYN